MPQFDRLGNDMSDDIADALAEEQDKADVAHQALMKVLVQAVKDHAKAHYEEGGWDMVVECYEDTEIEEEVAGCTTPEQAIARLAEVAGIYHDRRLDAWHAGGLDDNGREPEEKKEVSHSHCDCRDADDCCDFCSYMAWMSDMRDSGPTCEDGGYKPNRFPPPWSDHICYNQSGNIYGTYTGCFLSQEECENDIPF